MFPEWSQPGMVWGTITCGYRSQSPSTIVRINQSPTTIYPLSTINQPSLSMNQPPSWLNHHYNHHWSSSLIIIHPSFSLSQVLCVLDPYCTCDLALPRHLASPVAPLWHLRRLKRRPWQVVSLPVGGGGRSLLPSPRNEPIGSAGRAVENFRDQICMQNANQICITRSNDEILLHPGRWLLLISDILVVATINQ